MMPTIRMRLTGRMTVVMVAAAAVALLAFVATSSALTGGFSGVSPWAAADLVAIIVVTGAVGLVVADHQPGNPIGWLLAGESVFMLLTIAGFTWAQLVYRFGYHALAFAAVPALVLNQLFNVSLAGFPLVVLLFPDGRLPSRRWRPVVASYLAIAAAAIMATTIAVVQVAAGHHIVLQADGNLASRAKGVPLGLSWRRRCSSSPWGSSGWPRSSPRRSAGDSRRASAASS